MITPEQVKEKTPKIFWSKINFPINHYDCWEWTTSTSEGYGQIHISKPNGKWGKTKSHRYLFIKLFGEISSKIFVCHKCDNRRCCNPLHFFLGTHKDNMQDMWQKGRAIIPDNNGSKNGRAILTEENVREIRKESKSYGMGTFLARKFNVSSSAIYAIRDGTHWKNTI